MSQQLVDAWNKMYAGTKNISLKKAFFHKNNLITIADYFIFLSILYISDCKFKIGIF